MKIMLTKIRVRKIYDFCSEFDLSVHENRRQKIWREAEQVFPTTKEQLNEMITRMSSFVTVSILIYVSDWSRHKTGDQEREHEAPSYSGSTKKKPAIIFVE